MFTVYVINNAIMNQKTAGEYASREDAEQRALEEATGKRSFVESAVMAPNGKVVARFAAGQCTLRVELGRNRYRAI
jgi:hypothetical protein